MNGNVRRHSLLKEILFISSPSVYINNVGKKQQLTAALIFSCIEKRIATHDYQTV